MTTGNCPSATDNYQLVTDNKSPTTDNHPLATDDRQPSIGNYPLVTGNRPPATDRYPAGLKVVGGRTRRACLENIQCGGASPPPYVMKDKDKQKTGYAPKEYTAVDNIDRDKYSEEEIERAREEVASQNKRVKSLSILSVIWTFLSTVYAIVSTCILVTRRWVDHTVTYVLIGILVLYVGIFIGVAVAAFTSPKEGKKNLKGLKTTVKFLKPIMSIVLVALSITQIIAISGEAFSIAKVAFMALTILVAVLQIVFRVLLLAAGARAKKIAKGYKVRLERYVDGKKKKKTLRAKLREKQYRDE